MASARASDQTDYPSPSQIEAELRNAPAYLLERKTGQYLGLRVHWILRLFSVSPARGSVLLVGFKHRKAYPLVVCQVTAQKYPELKTARRGAKFEVVGKISDIMLRGTHITLKDARLQRVR